MKKHLKWIIPVSIVLVLALAAGGAFLLFSQNQQQTSVPADVKLCWNINGSDYRGDPTVTPSRPRDDNGLYFINFASDGEQLRLQVTEDVIKKGIDMHDLVGLVLDEKGIVTDFYAVEDCTGGYAADEYFVVSIDGNTVTCNSAPMYDGFTVSFDINENTKIYRNDGNSPLTGMPTQIAAEDEITAIKDKDGNVILVYVSPLESIPDVYWNVTRKYNSTSKSTTREADLLGYYTYEMAVRGAPITVRTRDMSVANAMDRIAGRNMVLTFDEEGLVTGVTEGSKVTGNYLASWCAVTAIDGKNLEFTRVLSGSNQGTVYTGVAANNFVAYDVSGMNEIMGAETELKIGDTVHCLTNKRGQVCIAFVVDRVAESPLYWNVERRYNSTTKQTTRHVKADGYYHVRVAVEGKQMTVRVKDRALVNAMDNKAAKHFGLKLNGDIVEAVYTAAQATGGTYFASWCDVTKIENGVVTAVRTKSGSNHGTFYSCKMAPDCKVYNVTSAATLVGEETELRVGDEIHGQTNMNGELVVIYVVGHRTVVGAKIYWNVNRKYNSTTKLSTRTPDADGWYTFLLACEGEQVTVKTKDAAIVQKMDAKADRYFGLKVNKDGEITRYMSADSVTGGSYFASWCDVIEIDGDYVTAERTISGSNQGEKYTAKMQKDVQVYNVSDNYISFVGEKTELRVGDRIQGHKNIYGGLAVIFVVSRPDIPGEPDHFHCACNGNSVGVGDHVCDNETGWSAWINPRRLPTSGNWYLTTDVQLEATVSIPVGSTLNLCLNGHTVTGYEGTSNALGVSSGLTITDCSPEAQWGSIIGQNDAYGSVMYIYENKSPATVNLFAGHLKSNLTEPKTKDGGLIYIGSNGANPAVLNIYGGTLTGVDAGEKVGGVINLIHGNTINVYGGTINGSNAKYGGAIYIGNGTVNVHGGTIDGGTAYNGGAIYIKKGGMNIYGGTIQNGEASFDGGNVYMENGTINIHGGTVTGGIAANEGGNFRYSGTINMYGGTVSYGGQKDGTTVTKKGGNFMSFGLLNIEGGTISYGKAKNAGGNISTWGKSSHVVLKNGVVEWGGASSGSNIYIANTTTSDRSKLTISGGIVRHGGNIFLDYGAATMTGGTVSDGFSVSKSSTLSISGAPVIAGRHDFNLKLSDGASLTIGDLTDGAKIYVTLSDTSQTFGQLTDVSDKAYFYSDNKELTIEMDSENRLYLKGKHTHCVCGGHYDDHSCANAQFAEWSDPNSLPTSGSYFLTTDVTLSSALTVPQGSTLTLCLNGHTVSRTSGTGSVFFVNTGLNITDCSAESKWGAVYSGIDTYGCVMYLYEHDGPTTVNIYAGNFYSTRTSQTKDGGLIYIGNQGKNLAKLNIYNGKFTGLDVGTAGGGVINIIKGGQLNMYGGTITGGTAQLGGGIRLTDASTFNMYGGTIENNHTTKNGGAVYAANTSTVSLYGGTIQKNTSDFDGAGVYLYNSAKLNIYDKALITNNTADNEGGNIRTNGSNVINMYGGVVSDGNAKSGGNLMLFGTLNMYSGTIKDGKAANLGGNINTWGSPKINLSKHADYPTAPVISGGKATTGGNVFFRGTAPTLTMSYGSITGGTATTGSCFHLTKGSATLSGTAVIDAVNIAGGTFAVGTFDEGASIGITMSTPGTFLTDCSDLTAFIKAANSAYEVIYDGSNMVLKAK